MDKLPPTPFWLNEPTILFNKKHITEIWPNSNMSNMEKLNAISRFVIIASILGYLITLNIGLIFVCIVTLGVIAILYHVQSNKTKKEELEKSKDKPEKIKESLSSRRKDRINPNELKGFSIVDLAVAFNNDKRIKLKEKSEQLKAEEVAILSARAEYTGNKNDIDIKDTREDE